MTAVQPTLQQPGQVDSRKLLEAHELEISKNLNCVRVGIIQAFHAASQTVDVKIAQQKVTSIQPDGTKTYADYAPLKGVPVLFFGGGGFTVTLPVAVGDECLLLFNDREIDNWYLTGKVIAPTTGRLHDLSDAIAIVGVRNSQRTLAGISTTGLQIRSDDGATLIDMTPGKIQLIADEVVIHGRLKTTLDAGGTGFVYTPGQIDTYTDGVPTGNHAPTPPEVPT